MTAPFQAAWMLLKEGGFRTEENPHDTRAHNDARIAQHEQAHGAPIPQPSNDGQRLIDMLSNGGGDEHEEGGGGSGHELNLPEEDKVEGLMEDRNVMGEDHQRMLQDFNNSLHHGTTDMSNAANSRDAHRIQGVLNEGMEGRENLLDTMEENQHGQEMYGGHIENQIRDDDQREGQQPEADEMEAMGGEPMGQHLGGKPPENIGQAGSLSDANPERHSINPFAMDDAMNTFRPPQALHDWAAGNNQQPREERPKISDEQVESDIDAHYEGQPLQDEGANPPTSGRTMQNSPRQEKRGHEGAGRAHDRPGFRSGEHMPL